MTDETVSHELTPAYKGFQSDLTCRGFRYAEGETYEHPGAVALCSSGFHACPRPLDVWRYYPPHSGRLYHQVELGDAKGEGDKIVGRTIRIGARVSIAGLIKAHLGLVFEHVRTAERPALPSGDWSTAATSGDGSTAATSGDGSTAATSGHGSTAATSGDGSTAATSGAESIAVAGGYQCRASGAEGCWLVLAERDDAGHIIEVVTAKVGCMRRGVHIEPGVAYMLRDGQVVEA